MRRARALVVLGLALAASARAWPVDVVVDVQPGKEVFRKLSVVEWVEVEDPKIATAEILESGELLISGKAPGRTLLLLYAEGRYAVWRLRVGSRAGEAALPGAEAQVAAKKACPDLRVTGEGDESNITASVTEERCRKALLAWFTTDAVVARQLELTIELSSLQTQLSAVQAALPKSIRDRVELRYLGAGLVLSGSLSAAEHRALLWTIFRNTLGRPSVDDEIELPGATPDGG